ncbi:signal transduction histidine kinase [Stackebrandtia albiflava]|uniref:histidine kinase n=1 Tax=Stackebrandtia albiflava TaxID=406432 RepID=A0A562VE32_9ACTN|nr:histidine kinase [Stackebrandtia albiflava]TWJ16122.1 signal transduction histidine kinase [Stackebrandtia albiflava]
MSDPRPITVAARGLAGLLAGAATAVPQLCGLVVTAVVPSSGWRRRTVEAGARLHVARMRWARPGWEAGAPRRPLLFLWVVTALGLMTTAIVVLIVAGAGVSLNAGVSWAMGRTIDDIPPSPGNIAYLGLLAAVLAFLAVQGLVGVAALEYRVGDRLLNPHPDRVLRERIDSLTSSRAAIVAAVDAERRRIERDLHDGVQQHVLALGMLIGRARRRGGTDDPVLAQAQETTARLLTELRQVSWRVFPAELDAAGLAAALEGLRDRAAVDVVLRHHATGELPDAVETAAYFLVSEAVTNAAKHSGADRVTVTVDRGDGELVVTVVDDGCGGADPAGGGLAGLARRIAALDGELVVDSPVGGPTTVVGRIPCD